MSGAGADTPMPDSSTFDGLPAASWLIWSVALRLLNADGVKRSVTRHDDAGVTTAPAAQVDPTCVYSAALPPVIVMAPRCRSMLPVFVSTVDCSGEAVLTITEPKSSVVGDNETSGRNKALPDSAMFVVPPAALCVTTMRAVRGDWVDGVNTTVTRQAGAPTAMLGPQVLPVMLKSAGRLSASAMLVRFNAALPELPMSTDRVDVAPGSVGGKVSDDGVTPITEINWVEPLIASGMLWVVFCAALGP